MSEAAAQQEAHETAELSAPASGMWKDAFRTLRRRPDAVISAIWILVVILMAAAPWIFTSKNYLDCDPDDIKISPQWFGGEHFLGTNNQGCDYYAMTIAGARPSIFLSLMVIAITVTVGFILGGLAGYYGGWLDAIVSRAVEVWMVIPFFLGALLLLTLFQDFKLGGGQILAVIPPTLALAFFGWTTDTRLVRASVIQAKQFDYVHAARALGGSDRRLLFRHVLPNAVAPVVSGLPIAVGAYITTEAALSVLGLGVRPPATSWGTLIAEGAPWVQGGLPHLLIIPGFVLLLTILAFALLGDALRDALDPKLR
ncbi:MAG: ABC transporter permease [Stackebrandtia sp.]